MLKVASACPSLMGPSARPGPNRELYLDATSISLLRFERRNLLSPCVQHLFKYACPPADTCSWEQIMALRQASLLGTRAGAALRRDATSAHRRRKAKNAHGNPANNLKLWGSSRDFHPSGRSEMLPIIGGALAVAAVATGLRYLVRAGTVGGPCFISVLTGLDPFPQTEHERPSNNYIVSTIPTCFIVDVETVVAA